MAKLKIDENDLELVAYKILAERLSDKREIFVGEVLDLLANRVFWRYSAGSLSRFHDSLKTLFSPNN